MAFLKTSLWFVPTLLIPVICGKPCDFGTDFSTSPTFATGGFAPETAVESPPTSMFISDVRIDCDLTTQSWSVEMDVVGQPDVGVAYPRYFDEATSILFESHEMLGQIHPSEEGLSLFVLDLFAAEGDDWFSGMSTKIPCDESPFPYTVWVFEVVGQGGSVRDCIIYGQEAEQYTGEFPGCTVW